MSDEPDLRKQRSAMLSVMLAVAGGMACTVFLIMLTGGLFLYVVAGAGLLFGFVGLHYLVWGRLLTGLLREQIDEAELMERARDQERPPPSTAYRQR